MTRGNKTISNSTRPQIDNLKCQLRYATNPFDGTGRIFKTAISELRKEGVSIIRDKDKCRYYNPLTVNVKWGYN